MLDLVGKARVLWIMLVYREVHGRGGAASGVDVASEWLSERATNANELLYSVLLYSCTPVRTVTYNVNKRLQSGWLAGWLWS